MEAPTPVGEHLLDTADSPKLLCLCCRFSLYHGLSTSADM
jgi:hypothetical protein